MRQRITFPGGIAMRQQAVNLHTGGPVEKSW
jgi:hypothetical protein